MPRPDKVTAVAELTESFRSSSAAVLTEYRGLTVAQLKTLRRTLGADSSYAVVKNTLTKIAAREAGLADLEPLLQGPSAIAFVSGDPVEAAKGLRDFAKANPLLVIKGGVLDGRMVTADEIKKLADLESREVLLAKLAGAMKASLSGAAALFQAPLAQAARTIEALRQKVEADPASAAAAPAAETAEVIEAAEAAPSEEVADEAPAAVDEVVEEVAAPEAAATDETPAEADTTEA